jgi:16S rRNA processing protein RimM
VADRICVAQIGAAHGLRGEVRLRSFTEDPRAVTTYGPLESEDGARRFEIEGLRPAKDHFVARLAGVTDRDAAEKLTNLRLYVSRDRLPPVEEADTYYHADLVGLAAVTPDGVHIGVVNAIHNFGAGDIVEIKRNGADPLLMPFTEATVPEIDVRAGRMVVAPPAETE